MDKSSESKNTAALTRLLKRIGKGDDPKLLRKEATKLMSTLQPSDIAVAEQNLIDNGYPAHLVQQLSAAFMLMGVLNQNGPAIKGTLKYNHILRLVISEHEMTKCFIADLEETANNIYMNNNLNDRCTDFRKLCHIIEHLDCLEEHIEREEDVIFPYLRKYGWTSLCKAAQNDHTYIRIAISDLICLVTSFNPNNTRQFKTRLNTITKYLCPILKEHIFQEDTILYPIALQVIKDKTVWDKIKGICDEIGYCGVHM